MAKEVIDPDGEATAIVLLSEWDVPVNLPSKYVCLCPYIITVVHFSPGAKPFCSGW